MEEWKPCIHESRYLVSSVGWVWDAWKERIVSQHKDPKGYWRVNICRSNGKWECIRVHLLLCYAFHGLPPSDHHEAAHHDDEKDNNTPENVYWKTQRQNIEDKIRNGRTKSGTPRKLSDDQVRALIADYAAGGHTWRSLAAKYGVAKGVVQSILQRKGNYRRF